MQELAEIGTDSAPRSGWRTWRSHVPLALILLVCCSAITLAMRRTSTTFDETIMIAGGARGYTTGDWSISPEHPPLTQYLYGWLPYLTRPNYPDESVVGLERYRYSSTFFFGAGNNPETLAFLGRLPAVLCVLVLVVVVYQVTRRRFGEPAGLLAAMLVAFLPDVLAHGGVAYNDVPVTLAIFAGVWLADTAVRRPALRSGLAFGIVAGLALATKNSAVTLAPMAVLLLVAELMMRRNERAWLMRVATMIAAALVGVYVALVLVYRGDLTLSEYRYAIGFVFDQVTVAEVPSYLLGERVVGGRWSYFPLAFLFKTPAAFHLLLVLAAAHFIVRARAPGAWDRILQSQLRVPLVALLVFVPVLLTSELNIGFRYALPALPMLCVLTAAGVVGAWRTYGRPLRMAVLASTIWFVAHPLSYYPNFLSYISEYGPGRDRNYTVLVDSSMDWGQGLIQLRDFLRKQGIPRVYLSYYGTAWPAAYGVDYVPVLSFFELPDPGSTSATPPEHIVISATNLAGGGYLGHVDPYRVFRQRTPDHVVANTMFVYRLR